MKRYWRSLVSLTLVFAVLSGSAWAAAPSKLKDHADVMAHLEHLTSSSVMEKGTAKSVSVASSLEAEVMTAVAADSPLQASPFKGKNADVPSPATAIHVEAPMFLSAGTPLPTPVPTYAPSAVGDSLVLPSSLRIIESNAFQSTSVKYAFLSYGTQKIDEGAFSNCASLQLVYIPRTVTSIGEGAFSGCPHLTVEVESGSYAHTWCKQKNIPCKVYASGFIFEAVDDSICLTGYNGNQTEIAIPSAAGGLRVTSIGENAFNGHSTLKRVTVPEGIVHIGQNAFKGCSSLTSVALSSDVASIGKGAFSGCSKLCILAPEESYAWKWCKNNGVSLVRAVDSVVFYSESTHMEHMRTGDTEFISIGVEPQNAYWTDCTLTSSNASVLTVSAVSNSEWQITAKQPGKVQLTANIQEYSGISEYEMDIEVHSSLIQVPSFSYTTSKTSLTIPVTFYGDTIAFDDSFSNDLFECEWASSWVGDTINLKVSFIESGTGTLVLYDDDHPSDSISLSITAEIPLASFTIDSPPSTMLIGTAEYPLISCTPSSAYIQGFMTTTSDSSVIDFDEDGALVACKPGTSKITLDIDTANNKTLSKSKTVRVHGPILTISSWKVSGSGRYTSFIVQNKNDVPIWIEPTAWVVEGEYYSECYNRWSEDEYGWLIQPGASALCYFEDPYGWLPSSISSDDYLMLWFSCNDRDYVGFKGAVNGYARWDIEEDWAYTWSGNFQMLE